MANNNTLHSRIIADPQILGGKPVVRGTRVPVDLVIKYLAEDLDVGTVLDAFPRLTREDVQACLDYAQHLVSGDETIFVASGTPRAEA